MNCLVISIHQLLKGKMLKSAGSPESLSLFSPDLAVGHPQGESVGIFLCILGTTGKTHRREIFHLLQIPNMLFCSILPTYLHLQKKEEEKKTTGIENSFST